MAERENLLTGLHQAKSIAEMVAIQTDSRRFNPALWAIVELLEACISLAERLIEEEQP